MGGSSFLALKGGYQKYYCEVPLRGMQGAVFDTSQSALSGKEIADSADRKATKKYLKKG